MNVDGRNIHYHEKAQKCERKINLSHYSEGSGAAGQIGEALWEVEENKVS